MPLAPKPNCGWSILYQVVPNRHYAVWVGEKQSLLTDSVILQSADQATESRLNNGGNARSAWPLSPRSFTELTPSQHDTEEVEDFVTFNGASASHRLPFARCLCCLDQRKSVSWLLRSMLCKIRLWWWAYPLHYSRELEGSRWCWQACFHFFFPGGRGCGGWRQRGW